MTGEGLVGNAFSQSRLVFSHDVQNLTPIQYPLFAFARQYDLHASVAVGVSLKQQPDRVAVLELFLTSGSAEGGFQQVRH
jgi:hypothetical protein